MDIAYVYIYILILTSAVSTNEKITHAICIKVRMMMRSTMFSSAQFAHFAHKLLRSLEIDIKPCSTLAIELSGGKMDEFYA